MRERGKKVNNEGRVEEEKEGRGENERKGSKEQEDRVVCV